MIATEQKQDGTAARVTGPPWPDPAGLRRRIGAIVRDPLFAFLIVGGGFFAAYHAIEASRKEPVHYSREIQAAQVEEFEMLAGRKASEADKARMRDNFIADELLFREAIARGMHLTDSQTRKHLTDKVRYLIAGAPPEPTEEQLVDYYSDNLKRYQAEPKISFSQVFYSAAPADPAAVLAALNAGQRVGGDDFWLGRDYPQYGESMVRGIFGQPFVERLRKAPDGAWFGPVRSPRGWHFVRKDRSFAPSLMPYAQIRDQVRQDFMMAATNSVVDREVAKLKEKFDVRIDR
ncbi:peptidyl-prolyl cis-trans isomerase [Edaphosphingomonas haloaromaticamans]|uniref:peptidylprolyl isomerase n=1 Tax=Edaphosphingomonas haloaromaticamans TaxID=653954 RepID=A0A1S1HHQ9_9SPHN|nr:peptidylprolyl isomerase [Sphingomonas haloaromaticamans]OHT21829.1 hypothetical protein BHE75_03840 [Sphingomonas haloaromaticamans]